jgi:endonuclease/exonuclease/phosphatase family metal-dependent hydrolase
MLLGPTTMHASTSPHDSATAAGAVQSQPPSRIVLKVLTLNAHKGFTSFNRRMVLHELRDAVRGTLADVVFLQEVIGAHVEHSARYADWPSTPQYEFLADEIWHAYAYGRNAVYPEGHHGNALLSKFPIVHHENHDVSVAGPEQRGLLHCVLQMPEPAPQLHAICVHLGLRAAHRRRQLDLLCRLVERDVPDDAPLIVAGDFNDWFSEAHLWLRRCQGLREVFVETGGKAARSFPARWPLLRLDRIYVRNVDIRHQAVLALRPWSHLSDHAGLLAEVAA